MFCASFVVQTTSQYYFVPQSLHKTRSSTTLYHKACTKHFPVLLCTTKLAQNDFPVLLCTTKLAQNTFQYYFVLQSLRKTLPNITLYCKACTKHFPVLLCTTKLAQTTSQYYCDQATLRQPLQCDLQRLSCKTQKNYAQRCRKLQLQNRISTPKQKKDDFEALSKRIFKRKIISAKIAKIC